MPYAGPRSSSEHVLHKPLDMVTGKIVEHSRVQWCEGRAEGELIRHVCLKRFCMHVVLVLVRLMAMLAIVKMLPTSIRSQVTRFYKYVQCNAAATCVFKEGWYIMIVFMAAIMAARIGLGPACNAVRKPEYEEMTVLHAPGCMYPPPFCTSQETARRKKNTAVAC